MAEKKLGQGSRLNDNKIRHDLFEPFAINELAKVFTKGQLKYPDPPHNWLYGMDWSKCLASLKRHINAFERGEDFDFDSNCEDCKKGECKNHTGLFHMAHAAWNALALVSYTKFFPQGDNRLHHVLPTKRIGLDIDDVICSWVTEWANLQGIPTPTCWNFDYELAEKFKFMNVREENFLMSPLEEFYLNLPVKEDPKNIPFIPECYITHRPVSKELTELWLKQNGFPLKPVFQVTNREEKLQVAKDMNLDIFVDDNFDTYMMMNRGGICAYLYDALHNQRHDVGYRRIKSLKELPW
jgi:hypothetical protein